MALTVKRPEKRIDVCLDGSLQAAWESAEAELTQARERRLMDARLVSKVTELAEKVRGIEEEARAASVTFLLRALGRREWDKFVEDHPAREGEKLDEHYGYNTATIFDAVLGSKDPATIISVTRQDGKAEKFDPTEWPEFADQLTNQQYSEFQVAVTALNRGRTEVPFSPAAYRETRNSVKS